MEWVGRVLKVRGVEFLSGMEGGIHGVEGGVQEMMMIFRGVG